MYPRGRPVIWQRLCIRTGALFGGSFCNPSQSPAAFNAARFSAYRATIRARLRSRAFIDSLAILVLFERESETFQERFRLFVCIRRCNNSNVHAVEVLHFIQVDFRENHLLLDAKSEIASAIKAFGTHTLEITRSGQGYRDQAIEEIKHAVATQRDAGSDWHSLTQLKVRYVFG